ncbi:MAG TPA: ABC transporter ATP-binding protein, partial [Thermoleophilia bacterium]|nr:ABC transporter ATP-binding protein [Thermoleophilia bacterium]
MTATGLGFTYPTRIKPALEGLTFAVSSGETVLVLGPSGSGKSTLTLCLDGLIPHLVEGDYEGAVAVAGLVVADNPVHVLAQETGLVFQDPDAQFCTLTVEEEIAFGLENLKRTPEDIERAIDRALDDVGLPGYRSRQLETLSGGEKQRVAIAAVLAMGPRLLVLDEPSANLDPRGTAELFALVKRLAKDGRHTVLIIEHKLDQIIDWVDSVLVLGQGGRLLYRGDARTVFYERAGTLEEMGVWRPQSAELALALRNMGWRVPGSPLSIDETVSALIATPGLVGRLRNGKGAAAAPGRPAASLATEAILRTERLNYFYPDGHQALRDVTMSLDRGSFTAIAGTNGAGKTTLAALLTGAREAPRGQVFFEGTDISSLRPWAVSDRAGLVFQNPEHQFVTDTVFGELAFSLVPRAGRRRAGRLSAEQRALVESWLDRLGLLPLAEANPFSLSQGQKRRLSVGSMLIRGQSVLVLDEPTLGQDELQSQRLMTMMHELRAEGRTISMVTHDMRLVAENADSLVVLNGGRLTFSGTPAEFFSKPGELQAAGL